ncbi:MAG: glutamate racemase [Salibacteraceae bacterium]
MKDCIGIFDSGIGGLSVYRAINALLPSESTIYLGDGINAPYGEKSREEIIDLSIRNTEWLLERGAKMIVVACNTATTNAIDTLRSRYDVPFVGIEPATKPAAIQTKTGKIGILATRGTFASELYLTTSKAHRGTVEIIETIGTGLVPLIEHGELEKTRPLLKSYLEPMVKAGVDNIVLGCTHYPFLINIIKEIVPTTVSIIEPSKAIAQHVQRILDSRNLFNADSNTLHEFYTTADPQIMESFVTTIHSSSAKVAYVSF